MAALMANIVEVLANIDHVDSTHLFPAQNRLVQSQPEDYKDDFVVDDREVDEDYLYRCSRIISTNNSRFMNNLMKKRPELRTVPPVASLAAYLEVRNKGYDLSSPPETVLLADTPTLRFSIEDVVAEEQERALTELRLWRQRAMVEVSRTDH
jgi:hypothetical protein